MQVPLALYVLWDKAIIQDKINNVTESSSIMLVISGGYFLHDLIVCIVSHEGAAYVVHASVCLSAFLYSFLNDHLHYYGKHVTISFVEEQFVEDQLSWLVLSLVNGTAPGIINFLLKVASVGRTSFAITYAQ